ncbi:hypothetical protein ACFXOL_10800 [Streptomyces californicus]|uniref:hypothetical protein n=1 Tax=Streptomyces californicus TaxID=67351 RepID=UPI00364C63A8
MKLTFTDDVTAERITALLATFAAVLVAVLAMKADFGIGDTAGAAFFAYVMTVGAVAWKVPLQLGRVVLATGKGALITGVITVILVIAFWRAVKGL